MQCDLNSKQTEVTSAVGGGSVVIYEKKTKQTNKGKINREKYKRKKDILNPQLV